VEPGVVGDRFEGGAQVRDLLGESGQGAGFGLSGEVPGENELRQGGEIDWFTFQVFHRAPIGRRDDAKGLSRPRREEAFREQLRHRPADRRDCRSLCGDRGNVGMFGQRVGRKVG